MKEGWKCWGLGIVELRACQKIGKKNWDFRELCSEMEKQERRQKGIK
jgi:hypothetical protein